MAWIDLGKRSRVTVGGRLAAAGCLVLTGGAAIALLPESGAAGWFVLATALVGLLALLFTGRPGRDGIPDEMELIEAARRAIRAEADRLDDKRVELEKRVLAYGEWLEFPDFTQLRTADWTAIARSEQDDEVAALMAAESDAMLARFSDGTYFAEGRFHTRILLLDLYSFVEKVAKIYQPGSERPILETNLEALLKAINRASLQVILLLEEIPLVEVKALNIRQVSERVRQANQVYRKYEGLQPFLEPMRYLWQGSKFLFASNPLVAAGWIAGSEIVWRGGMRFGRRALDAYVLRLVRQSLGIIAWETASIYDRTHRYRNPDWVFAVELAHLVSQFPLSKDVLRESLKEIATTPLKSSYDRIFLYRCIAQGVSPRPERFSQSELLSAETRDRIRSRLERFRSAHFPAAGERDVAKWRAKLLARLGFPSEPAFGRSRIVRPEE